MWGGTGGGSGPASTTRGRGIDLTAQWRRIGVNVPRSLHQRVLGAAQFAADTGIVPGVTSGNRLIAAALDEYLTGLEAEYRAGQTFEDPRRRLSGGRTPSGRGE